MGSKYEYLNTKIHIDKKGKGGGGTYVFLHCRHRNHFFFRILFLPGTFCRVLWIFLGFHKIFVWYSSLYYQMSHYGFRLGAWWRSEIDRGGGELGLVLEENNTTQKVPNSGAI